MCDIKSDNYIKQQAYCNFELWDGKQEDGKFWTEWQQANFDFPKVMSTTNDYTVPRGGTKIYLTLSMQCEFSSHECCMMV